MHLGQGSRAVAADGAELFVVCVCVGGGFEKHERQGASAAVRRTAGSAAGNTAGSSTAGSTAAVL